MRILHISKYWQKYGGIESHVKSLCRELSMHGVEVTVLASSEGGTSSRLRKDGYAVIESGCLGELFGVTISPSMILDAMELRSSKSFDVIHLHFPNPMAHLVSELFPKCIPRVITWHSDIVRQKILLKFYKPFLKKALNEASAIVAHTASHFQLSDQISINYPNEKLHVIAPGVNFDTYTLSPERIKKTYQIRQKFAGKFLVFAVGRHVEYKGFKFLIEAMKYVDAHLVLAGEGPLTKFFKLQIVANNLSKRIALVGTLNNEDLMAHYNACDIFCLPSISQAEAFGLVQLEAMASGKPVICTQLYNGVNELNVHGLTGLAVPPKDSRSLAMAIEQLKVDSCFRDNLGKAAKDIAKQKYSLKKMVLHHINLYQKIINSLS